MKDNLSLTFICGFFMELNGNALQYSCLENSMDEGTWWAIVHGVTKSWTRLSDFTLWNWFCFTIRVV